MNKYSIEITVPAERDLYQISQYISHELLEPDIAQNLIDKIGNAIISLEEYPLRNALVSDERLSLQGIRRIIIENYSVFYIVSEQNNKTIIIRILYNRRNWTELI